MRSATEASHPVRADARSSPLPAGRENSAGRLEWRPAKRRSPLLVLRLSDLLRSARNAQATRSARPMPTRRSASGRPVAAPDRESPAAAPDRPGEADHDEEKLLVVLRFPGGKRSW